MIEQFTFTTQSNAHVEVNYNEQLEDYAISISGSLSRKELEIASKEIDRIINLKKA